jgi:sodium/pantothenate symporter
MHPTFLLAEGSNAALITFLIYTLAVFGIAGLSNQLLKSRNFMSEYFLGSRGLGVWAFALTFAATSSSGGSFTGFPAKIYSHGWILALWIGSYMVVPICTMGLMGKRLNHMARASGAITVPDVLRDRFNSQKFGLLSVVLIVFFMSFNLVAQFKAGALILAKLLSDVSLFHSASDAMFGGVTAPGAMLAGVDREYLLCLFAFGVAVIVYTTYGGFHAVVWTDVMQGIVMVVGVLIMLPLAITLAGRLAPDNMGGLEYTTRQMAAMTPPELGKATISVASDTTAETNLRGESWFVIPRNTDIGKTTSTVTTTDASHLPRLLRLTRTITIPAGSASLEEVDVLELTTPGDIERTLTLLSERSDAISRADLVGTATPLCVGQSGELVAATLVVTELKPYLTAKPGDFVSGPGPSEGDPSGFLPLSVAISFFFMWAISGAGQPSNMVRLMAFKDTLTLKRAIFTVAIYYTCIYMPLVFIFCCARVLIPGMEAEPDRIMPEMAVYLTSSVGAGWLGGLLIAAPFAAVMSTVDSFLLMISSAMVRDVYQRNISPNAKEQTIKRLSYLCTLIVGSLAMIVAINPPDFLQDIIVYVGSGLAACFLAPAIFMMYWPRSNVQGSTIGMLSGFSAHLAMYVAGMFTNGSFFKAYRLFNFDPIIVGLVVSFAVTYVATLATPAPPQELVRKYFYRKVTSGVEK